MEYQENSVDKSLEDVMRKLKYPSWQVRVLAVKQLAFFGYQVPVSLLVTAVTDEHRAVRVAALETCAALAAFVPVTLVEIGLTDPIWSVRAAAVWALASFAESAPLSRLQALFADTQEYGMVRASALYTLSMIQGRDFSKDLIAALSDAECFVREEAALLLGNLQERRAIEPLIIACQTDKEPLVRGATVLALRQMEDKTLETVFRQALRDDHEYVRAEAAQALGITESVVIPEDYNFFTTESEEDE